MRIHYPTLVALLVGTSFAKADPPAATLEGPSRKPTEPAACDCLVGYAGPMASVTRLAGETGFLVGGRGGAVLRHRFVLGAAGLTIVNDVNMPSSAALGPGSHNIGFSGGGFWFAYILLPETIVHVTGGVLLGGGSVSYQVTDQAPGVPATYTRSSFYQVAPEAEVEVNVLRFMRIALGGYYRFVANVKLENKLQNSDVAGPGALLLVKFGTY